MIALGSAPLTASRVQGADLRAIGDPEGLNAQHTTLFCSIPGDLVLKTYDMARAMRDAGVPVIGGFQMPVETECLRLLLRGNQPTQRNDRLFLAHATSHGKIETFARKLAKSSKPLLTLDSPANANLDADGAEGSTTILADSSG